MPARILNLVSPVNRSHPLARGLVAAWMPMPYGPYMQGARMLDLCNKNHLALTGGAGFRSGDRNGRGAISLDGTDDYAGTASAVGLPDISAAKSIAVLTRHDGTTAQRIIFSLVKDDTGGAGNASYLQIADHFGLVTVNASLWGGGTIQVEAYLDAANANIPGDTWFQAVHTCAAGGVTPKMYLDGKDWSFGASAGHAQTGAPAAVRVGSFNAAFPDPYHNRPIAYVFVWDRTLAADEVAAFYHESRLGFPGVLGWLGQRKSFAGVVAAAQLVPLPFLHGQAVRRAASY